MPERSNQSLANSPQRATVIGKLSQLTLRQGAMLLAGLALVVYLPALDGGYVLDDDLYLTNNRMIADDGGLYQLWTTTQTDTTMDYYPVSNTTLWIEWRLW